MAIVNLLKASFTGKLGQVVGAKWKNKSTIRTYTKPAYTNTPAQQVVREAFKDISSYVALFTDQLKPYSALNTKGMSLRNAIIQLNKGMIMTVPIDFTALELSRGGLPLAEDIKVSATGPIITPTVTWKKAFGATISFRAKVIVIACNKAQNYAHVEVADNDAETLTFSTPVPGTADTDIFAYVLDYRGSSKIASPSVHVGKI